MTINDDWDRFVAMMKDDPQWVCVHDLRAQQTYEAGHLRWRVSDGYLLDTDTGRESNIGDWRQWLEAGQSPPPW